MKIKNVDTTRTNWDLYPLQWLNNKKTNLFVVICTQREMQVIDGFYYLLIYIHGIDRHSFDFPITNDCQHV